MNKNIILNKIIVNKNRIDYDYTIPDDLKCYFAEGEHFFIEYPQSFDFTNVPVSILGIPFVMNLLSVAWLSDTVISVEELDQTFYDSLDNIKSGFERIHGEGVFGGKVEVESLVLNQYEAEGKSCVLFSGGVDALSATINHMDKNPVLINIWGADLRLENIDGHNAMELELQSLAKQLGLDYFYIKSSLRFILLERELEASYGNIMHDTWWHGMQHSIGMLSLLAPYNYNNKCMYNIIASSFTPETYINSNTGKIIPCCNYPFIDEALGMMSTKVIHDGFHLSRTKKIRDICKYSRSNNIHLHLKVCFHPKDGENCSNCEKCYRTIMALCALNEDPNIYGFKFNNNIEKKIKRYLSLNMLNDTVITLWKEISDYIAENNNTEYAWLANYKFNTGYHWYKRVYKKIRGLCGRIYRGVCSRVNF